jgi:hypothetical protein
MRRRFNVILTALLVFAGGAVVSFGSATAADGARRLAADILVAAGDAGRLARPGIQDPHRRGLRERIAGTLAVLPLSLKQAGARSQGRIEAARAALAAGDAARLSGVLAGLTAAYPFSVRGLLPADGRPAAVAGAKALHERLCAGCHDAPDLEVDRPAWNLSALARSMPPGEFAARMVVGVKGERLMAMDNPLTDAEISALIGYYLAAPPSQ